MVDSCLGLWFPLVWETQMGSATLLEMLFLLGKPTGTLLASLLDDLLDSESGTLSSDTVLVIV